MIRVKEDHFNIAQIAASGQCFRMDLSEQSISGGQTYRIIASDRCVNAEMTEDGCLLDCGREEYESFWKDYFDLGTDYSGYLNVVDPQDKYLANAALCGSGIRILRQDPWEMIVSFLISQQNNIKRIKRCIDNICRKYGREMMHTDGTRYFAFPGAEALAVLPEEGLMECNLGYRSRYVVRTARDVCEGRFDPAVLTGFDHEEARRELLGLFGVGEKVAECICLFGLHMIDAFPVDTHIKQALEREYPDGFPFERYRGFEGIMQQYIFYYELIRQQALPANG